MDGDVVQALAAFFHEFCDHRVRARCIQQFNSALTQVTYRQLKLLMRHGFFTNNFQPKLLVKFARLRQRFDCDSEMVNGVGHDERALLLLASGLWPLALSQQSSYMARSCYSLPTFSFLRVSVP